MEVPDDFYNIRPEELKREQKLREEAVKELGMLVTKEMRERERLKALRRWGFGLFVTHHQHNFHTPPPLYNLHPPPNIFSTPSLI